MILTILCFILIFCISAKIYSRINCARCQSYVCLEGKTALVTGGSLGIGYHIVCGLASRGCRVIIADKIISEDVKTAIYRETKNKNISYEYVDLASFESVRELAERIKKSEKKLDILIHNAGIGKSFGKLSEDGLNMPMQVNYYSAFLLTHLLVDLLKNSSAGRLIFASSGFAFLNVIKISKANSQDINLGTSQLDYHNSKFCMIAAADFFAEKLQQFNITSNSYHPGVVNTRIINQFKGKGMTTFEYIIGFLLDFALFWVGKSPEEGSQTPLHLACSNEVEKVTGKFFGEATPRSKPSKAYNKKLCNALWCHSERVVKLKPEEILS